MKRFCSIFMCLFTAISIMQIQPINAEEISVDDVCDPEVYICNDETGIPDKFLYELILLNWDTNGDGLLSKNEAKLCNQLSESDDLSEEVITSLIGIGHLENLEMLNLSGIDDKEGQHFDDISPLAELNPDKLKDLSLDHNGIKDISALAELVSLESLDVSYNELETLPDLTKLTNLKPERTSFKGNKIPKEELLAKLPDQLKNNEEWLKENACEDCKLPENPGDKEDPDDPTKPVDPIDPSDPQESKDPDQPEEPGDDFIYTLHDAPSGVSLVGKFPSDVQLVVKTLEDAERKEVTDTIKDASFVKKYQFEKIFDIYMLRNQVAYQPENAFQVVITLEKEWLDHNPKVVYISDEGEIVEITSSITDGKIIFTSNHNSYYAIVTDKEAERPLPEKEPGPDRPDGQNKPIITETGHKETTTQGHAYVILFMAAFAVSMTKKREINE